MGHRINTTFSKKEATDIKRMPKQKVRYPGTTLEDYKGRYLRDFLEKKGIKFYHFDHDEWGQKFDEEYNEHDRYWVSTQDIVDYYDKIQEDAEAEYRNFTADIYDKFYKLHPDVGYNSVEQREYMWENTKDKYPNGSPIDNSFNYWNNNILPRIYRKLGIGLTHREWLTHKDELDDFIHSPGNVITWDESILIEAMHVAIMNGYKTIAFNEG